MTKRGFIIHAWDESPKSCWYQWLKQKLESQDVEVQTPVMPNPATPDIEAWVGALSDLATNLDENTYFVGHSIGCQTILRYLARLTDGQQVGGAVFVAPWTHLIGLDEASTQIAKPWLETPIDWEAAKRHCLQFSALFSDDDRWVPLSESRVFQAQLNAKIQVIHNAGHFDGVPELPEVLKQITGIADT